MQKEYIDLLEYLLDKLTEEKPGIDARLSDVDAAAAEPFIIATRALLTENPPIALDQSLGYMGLRLANGDTIPLIARVEPVEQTGTTMSISSQRINHPRGSNMQVVNSGFGITGK